MSYSFFRQWHTLDGAYHSQSADYSAFDSAFGQMHNTVLPFINDSNVASFVFTIFDEYGVKVDQVKWTRPVEVTESDTANEG